MRRIETPLDPQTFNDGFVTFWGQKNIAPPGDKPQYRSFKRLGVPFADKKIGDVRYYSAMMADAKLDKVIRVPSVKGLQPSGDIATISGNERQYKVQKIAQNSSTDPASWDVTLELTKQTYSLEETEE